MSTAGFPPEIVVILEDGANRQMFDGFINQTGVNQRRIRREALPKIDKDKGGWKRVVEHLKTSVLPVMKEPRWCNRLVVLVLDKDAGSSENRYEHAMKDVPPELVNSRVFVIGALTEPEKLFRESGKSRRTFPGRSLTEVGGDLAYQCTHDATGDYDPQPGDAVDNRITWNQENLRHNLTVVKGLRAKIREMGDFLFE